VSRTRTTRRSRSGCQVRTTTVRLRALARQSIDRTSSPRTYSRSESNSVPWPRTRTAARPSSSRSRANRLGRCLRESNGGSERTVPSTSTVRCRPASPSGPPRRIVTPRARRSPRRRGSRGDRSTVRSPAARRIRCRFSLTPAVGCQASRSTPRIRRREVLVTWSVETAGDPSRTAPIASRRTSTTPGRGASSRSTPVTTRTTSNHSQTVPACGRRITGASPTRSSSGTRPVISMVGSWVRLSAARGRRRAPRRALRRRSHLRVRPLGVTPNGAPGWRGPAPSRRRE
jgi:hypothetical protein